MLSKLAGLARRIGKTPIQKLKSDELNLFAKLEYSNLSGSIKDRPAINILTEAVKNQIIVPGTTIVESSSGNFAIALAYMCAELDLKFVAVIDQNINKSYEELLLLMCSEIHKVSAYDVTKGFLLNRLEKVKEICNTRPNVFWTNQYDNLNNYLGYLPLAQEVINEMTELDYMFIAVSTGGAITGLSKILKSSYPNVQIVAVDIEGSVVFQGAGAKRYVSGIGSSLRSSIIEDAMIDEIVHVSHSDLFKGCSDLLKEQRIFAGASTGAVYFAIKRFFKNHKGAKPNIIFCCADNGYPYLDTVYNRAWVHEVTLEIKNSMIPQMRE